MMSIDEDHVLIQKAIKEGVISDISNAYGEVNCNVCATKMTGVVPLTAHLNGGPHNRKLKHINLFNSPIVHTDIKRNSNILPSTDKYSQQDQTSTTIKSEIDNGNIISKDGSISCKLCNVGPISGHQPLYAHIMGKSHLKKQNLSRCFDIGAATTPIPAPRKYYPLKTISQDVSSSTDSINIKQTQVLYNDEKNPIYVIRHGEDIRGHDIVKFMDE